MNFFKYISSNIIKWWQIHITPILHINNNKKGRDRFEGGDGSLENQYAADAAERAVESATNANPAINSQVSDGAYDDQISQNASGKSTINSDLLNNKIPDGTSADAMEVLNRINKEKDEARKRAVENQRKKREEEERIAAIMNAGKVDVNAFIEEGRSKAADHSENSHNNVDTYGSGSSDTEADSSVPVNADSETSGESSTSDATEEQLRRAQEIIDRLNREAAEDEAKKQAEIDAAKQRAKDAGLSD
ncbi:MAG: hypothetical protein IJ167_09190 [Lachnospiraceae bacterium]|nr:hypothetical protein [Lachnospiraceae bacterium]